MLDTVTCWLQAAGREPRLTDEELIILSRTIQSSSSGKVSKRAGQRALDRVIRANLRLIVTVMRKRFSWISLRGPLAADCLQEGSIGLRSAALRYQHQKGYRFSTYAAQWIAKEIGEYLRDRHRMIRVPLDCHSVAYTARKLAARSAARNGTAGSIALEEVASSLQKPLDTVRQYLQAFRSTDCMSANQQVQSEEGQELLQFLADPHQDYDEQQDQRAERIGTVLQAVFDGLGLSARERAIVCKRQLYTVPVTFRELGRTYGVTSAAIRCQYHRLMERIQCQLQRADVSLTHILSEV